MRHTRIRIVQLSSWKYCRFHIYPATLSSRIFASYLGRISKNYISLKLDNLSRPWLLLELDSQGELPSEFVLFSKNSHQTRLNWVQVFSEFHNLLLKDLLLHFELLFDLLQLSNHLNRFCSFFLHLWAVLPHWLQLVIPQLRVSV